MFLPVKKNCFEDVNGDGKDKTTGKKSCSSLGLHTCSLGHALRALRPSCYYVNGTGGCAALTASSTCLWFQQKLQKWKSHHGGWKGAALVAVLTMFCTIVRKSLTGVIKYIWNCFYMDSYYVWITSLLLLSQQNKNKLRNDLILFHGLVLVQ